MARGAATTFNTTHRARVHRGHRSPCVLARRACTRYALLQPLRFPAAPHSVGSVRSPSPPPSGACGESQALPLDNVHIFLINIRSALRNVSELACTLKCHKPHVVALCETWLDNSILHFDVEGYTCVSRRDRGSQGGGVLLLTSRDFPFVSALHVSEIAERIWCTLHTRIGPVLLCVWYRPPSEDPQLISQFVQELRQFEPNHIGVVALGDLNAHHAPWLRFSNGISTFGRLLKEVALENGLYQKVAAPTRGPYLLDLVLTNMPANVSIIVWPGIADHACVAACLNLPPLRAFPIHREVWTFRNADWSSLKRALRQQVWNLMPEGVVAACDWLTSALLKFTCRHSPRKLVKEMKCSHPWISFESYEAVCAKQSGHDHLSCTALLQRDYVNWLSRSKRQLFSLPKNSKRWWRFVHVLMHRSAGMTVVGPLLQDTEWVLDPQCIANAFASHFSSNRLSQVVPLNASMDEPAASIFVPVRVRSLRKLLANIDINKSSGPDDLPGVVLQKCSAEIAVPLAMLVRKMFAQCVWPDAWKMHRIVAILKRPPSSNLTNYRGIHVTPWLARVTEKLLADSFDECWEQARAYGESQWAYRKNHGVQELLAIMCFSWLLCLMEGVKVGLLLSDIAGAFDNVQMDILVEKLHRSGIAESFVRLLRSWLCDRVAHVVASGYRSNVVPLRNMVFQGTVLGPRLWNIFVRDVEDRIRAKRAHPQLFADDISCWKRFARHVPNATVVDEMLEVQRELHEWGDENMVRFDGHKEKIVVICAEHCDVECFRLLGVLFDNRLCMNACIDDIAGRARAKMKSILRLRSVLPVKGLIALYKAHVLPIVEWNCCTYYHVAPSVVSSIDGVYGSFAFQLGLSKEHLFLDGCLAPPRLRRDVAMLGLLWKVATGCAHSSLVALFPRAGPKTHDTRMGTSKHELQLFERAFLARNATYHRSVFGLVHVFNLLPKEVVHVGNVSLFQSKLTRIARNACKERVANWSCVFSPSHNWWEDVGRMRMFTQLFAHGKS